MFLMLHNVSHELIAISLLRKREPVALLCFCCQSVIQSYSQYFSNPINKTCVKKVTILVV